MFMPDKTTPIGKAHPLANAGKARLAVITDAAINPAPKNLK